MVIVAEPLPPPPSACNPFPLPLDAKDADDADAAAGGFGEGADGCIDINPFPPLPLFVPLVPAAALSLVLLLPVALLPFARRPDCFTCQSSDPISMASSSLSLSWPLSLSFSAGEAFPPSPVGGILPS